MNNIQQDYVNHDKRLLNPKNTLVFLAFFGVTFSLTFIYALDKSEVYKTYDLPIKDFETSTLATTSKRMTTPTTTTTTTIETTHSNKRYTILFYTTFFNQRPWRFVRKDYFQSCDCNIRSCNVSYDTKELFLADVVVFHANDMPPSSDLGIWHKHRRKGQIWTYFTLENPGNTPPVKPLDKLFDWSITYRLNSDIFSPYYSIIKQMKTGISPDINYAQGKTKQIAWLVSHCGTGRDRLARKLEEYGMELEVSGNCAGKFRKQMRKRCFNYMNCTGILKPYKFYFAAENDFCKDYVTEKYYNQGLMENAIPIVLGGADYTNPKLAIPGSYINPLDFNSPKEFVDYLKVLDKNDTMYNEYFKWKLNWKVEHFPKDCKKFTCDICKKLHSNDVVKHRPLSEQFAGDCEGPTKKYEEWIKRG